MGVIRDVRTVALKLRVANESRIAIWGRFHRSSKRDLVFPRRFDFN
jgi:hypothetical protein